MDKEKITLACTIKNIKFIGYIDGEFLSGESDPDSTCAHTRYDVNVVGEDCTVECIDEGKTENLSIGDVFIVPPKLYHNFHSKGKAKLKNYTFRFEFMIKERTQESISLYDEIVKNITPNKINYYYLPWAITISYRIKTEIESGSFASIEIAESEFKKFIILLLRVILNKNGKEGEKFSNNNDAMTRKEQIDNFFNHSYSIPGITINGLAKELNLSVRQVNRILKEEFDTSFHKKLTEVRLMHAKKILIKTDRTVEYIATRIGFNSVSGFFIAFKKEFGTTPANFRRINK